jgi:TetR/AcrR family transcriptional regulator, cholesterol catabolism regulator
MARPQGRSSTGAPDLADACSALPEGLLENAARMFKARGFASTTTRQLGAMAGINSGTLYYHIRNKEQLLFLVCLTSMSRISEAVHAAVAEVVDPLERLEVAVRAHTRSALQDADMHATMLVEMRSLSPESRARVRALRQEHETLITGLIEDAQRAAAIRTDIPLKILVLALLDLINWAIFWFSPDGEFDIDELAHDLLEIYRSGVLCRPGDA